MGNGQDDVGWRGRSLGNAEHQLGSPADADPPAPPADRSDAPDEAGEAELVLGVPWGTGSARGGPKGWHSRGYLPHRDHPGILQTITYRLADSLPAIQLDRIEAALRTTPPHLLDRERRRRMEQWLDAGHGSCLLRRPDAADLVVDTWRHFAGRRYDLIAWVVMPNHVHVLIRAYDEVALGTIVQSWKSYTGRRIAAMTATSEGGGAGGVWMRDYWDQFVRDERHFAAAVDYIHRNPVTAGLAERPEDWPWSSAAGPGPSGE